jgi:acetolactate synthase-1/2/3 large subunit
VKELYDGCICNIDIDEDPVKPQKAIWELRKILAPDAFVVTEVGQNQMWAAHFMRLRHPNQFITSGGMGTMGFGFPASIGVKYAHRDKQVVDVAGDGSFQMVFQELATAMSEDLPVVVCLLNNGWLGMVKQWQKLMWNRRYCGTELRNNPDFVKLAEAFGAGGITVTRSSELEDAFKTAFASDVPFVVDIRTDPEEDMLPMVPGGVSSLDGTIRNRCRWNKG